MARTVTKVEFSRRLRVSKARVSQYCEMGMPVRPDGSLDYHEAYAWVGANVARTGANLTAEVRTGTRRRVAPPATGAATADLNTQRTRLMRLRAEREELELARLSGELIPAEEVAEGWQSAVGRARSLLLGLPPAVAGEVVALVRLRPDDRQAEAAVRELLADTIHGALTELANTRVGDDDDQEGDEREPADRRSWGHGS